MWLSLELAELGRIPSTQPAARANTTTTIRHLRLARGRARPRSPPSVPNPPASPNPGASSNPTPSTSLDTSTPTTTATTTTATTVSTRVSAAAVRRLLRTRVAPMLIHMVPRVAEQLSPGQATTLLRSLASLRGRAGRIPGETLAAVCEAAAARLAAAAAAVAESGGGDAVAEAAEVYGLVSAVVGTAPRGVLTHEQQQREQQQKGTAAAAEAKAAARRIVVAAAALTAARLRAAPPAALVGGLLPVAARWAAAAGRVPWLRPAVQVGTTSTRKDVYCNDTCCSRTRGKYRRPARRFWAGRGGGWRVTGMYNT